MTGGRLLVRGGPDRDARLLAAKLAALEAQRRPGESHGQGTQPAE